jgi:hypothetical protein
MKIKLGKLYTVKYNWLVESEHRRQWSPMPEGSTPYVAVYDASLNPVDRVTLGEDMFVVLKEKYTRRDGIWNLTVLTKSGTYGTLRLSSHVFEIKQVK